MIALDKKLHFLICFAITIVLYPIIGYWAIGTAIATGVGKEIYDWKDYGNFSWGDILADIIGVIVGCFVILLVTLII